MNKIGLIVATVKEAKAFVKGKNFSTSNVKNRLFYKSSFYGKEIVLTYSHAGPVNAGATTEAIILNYNPDCIINFGSAGSHTQEILPGDIVIGKRFTSNYNVLDELNGIVRKRRSSLIRHYKLDKEERIDYLESDETLLKKACEAIEASEPMLIPMYAEEDWFEGIPYRKPKIIEANIGSEDSWTIDKDVIKQKMAQFNHSVEDKESAYIAQICHIHDVPFISIRSISDNELIQSTGTIQEIDKLIQISCNNLSIFLEGFIKKI